MGVVQSAGSSGLLVSTLSATLPGAVSAGNTIMVVLGGTLLNSTGSPTDNHGNTYHLAAIQGEPGSPLTAVALYYAYNVPAGSYTITDTSNWCSCCGSYGNGAMIVVEYSGLTTTDPLDKTAKNSGTTGTSATSGNTAATSQASEAVIGAGVVNATPTAGSGYGDLIIRQSGANPFYTLFEDKNVSATGPQSASFSWSLNSSWSCVCATFKAVSGTANMSTLNGGLSFVGGFRLVQVVKSLTARLNLSGLLTVTYRPALPAFVIHSRPAQRVWAYMRSRGASGAGTNVAAQGRQRHKGARGSGRLYAEVRGRIKS